MISEQTLSGLKAYHRSKPHGDAISYLVDNYRLLRDREQQDTKRLDFLHEKSTKAGWALREPRNRCGYRLYETGNPRLAGNIRETIDKAMEKARLDEEIQSMIIASDSEMGHMLHELQNRCTDKGLCFNLNFLVAHDNWRDCWFGAVKELGMTNYKFRATGTSVNTVVKEMLDWISRV